MVKDWLKLYSDLILILIGSSFMDIHAQCLILLDFSNICSDFDLFNVSKGVALGRVRQLPRQRYLSGRPTSPLRYR